MSLNIAVFHNLPSGGAKRVLFNQIRKLSSKNSIDLYQLSTAKIDFLNPEQYCNRVITENLKIPNNYFEYLRLIYIELPLLYNKIAQRIDNMSYDVVLIHPCFFTQAPYLLNFLKTPNIYNANETRREFYENIPRNKGSIAKKILINISRYPIKYIDKININNATQIITISNYMKALLKKIYAVNSHVVYPGIDTDFFKPIQSIHKENYVISVGALERIKGHDFIIKSISLMQNKNRPKLLLVGNGGKDRDYLIGLAEKLGVVLTIKEYVSDKELVKLLNVAKVFVYAPMREPFGLTALEAMSTGLPVLAVKEGGPAEILKNHAVFVQRNEKQMATKLTVLINKPQVYSINLRKYVIENFSLKSSIEKLEKYLKTTSKMELDKHRS